MHKICVYVIYGSGIFNWPYTMFNLLFQSHDTWRNHGGHTIASHEGMRLFPLNPVLVHGAWSIPEPTADMSVGICVFNVDEFTPDGRQKSFNDPKLE